MTEALGASSILCCYVQLIKDSKAYFFINSDFPKLLQCQHMLPYSPGCKSKFNEENHLGLVHWKKIYPLCIGTVRVNTLYLLTVLLSKADTAPILTMSSIVLGRKNVSEFTRICLSSSKNKICKCPLR